MKSKKNSKDSKKSNESKEKSSTKCKRLRQGVKILNENERRGEENKINYGQKRGGHEVNLMEEKEERISEEKRNKLNAFFGKKEGESSGRNG